MKRRQTKDELEFIAQEEKTDAVESWDPIRGLYAAALAIIMVAGVWTMMNLLVCSTAPMQLGWLGSAVWLSVASIMIYKWLSISAPFVMGREEAWSFFIAGGMVDCLVAGLVAVIAGMRPDMALWGGHTVVIVLAAGWVANSATWILAWRRLK